MNPGAYGHPLSSLRKFKVATGQTDPTGWDVYSSDGRFVGVVSDLLVDLKAMKVTQLVVKREGVRDAGCDRVLLPVEQSRIETVGQRVVSEEVASSGFGALPDFDPAASEAPEYKVAFLPHHQTPALGGGFYKVERKRKE